MTAVQLHVQGMSCAGCAMSVERRLRATTGVKEACVDLATATVDLRFDEEVVNQDDLEKVITALGFQVDYTMGQA